MRIIHLVIFSLVSLIANAQLVNRLQEDEKRLEFIKAYEQHKVVQIMGGKYAIEDLYYFYIDSKKHSPDGPYTEYKWTSKSNFTVGKDSINLIDLKVRNLSTGQTTTIPYVDALDYNIRFLKRRVKQ